MYLTSIFLKVRGAQIEASVTGTLTSGMVGIPVTIEYDEAWEGLTKNLVCRCSGQDTGSTEQRAILNVGNTAVVAHEVMQAGKHLWLGVEGYNADGTLVIPTTWAMCGVIQRGANTGDDFSADPTLPIWGQLQTKIEQIECGNIPPEQLEEIRACAGAAARAEENAAAASRLAADHADTARANGEAAQIYMENARTSAASAANMASDAFRYQTAAEAAAERAEGAAGSMQTPTLISPGGTVYQLAVRDDGTVYGIAVDGGEGDEVEAEAFTPFKFAHISDTHYQYSQDATAVLVANINALDDVDFVTNSGDITLDQSKDDAVKRTELAEYKAHLRDALNIPIYPCVGGHDLCDSMDIIWPEYTGVARLQEIGHKGCVILLADCLLSGWLDWLEERVAANEGKRIYIYEHHPIENDEFTVGLKPGETRVTWGDSEMRRILRLLRNNHNVIWFTGHTHWAFGIAERDAYNDEGRMGAVVHTPYLNALQGWMVEVGEAATMLRGVEFAESGMRYLGEGYDYAIVQDTTDYGEAEIITEGETVAVGGTVDISVHLAAAPRNSQTVHLIAADGIGIDKTELVFTPANYATPQTVTVTGNAAGTGKLTLYSRSRTTVRKVDVVAGAAVTNWFNKAKPLTPLGGYYGTGTSASYQLSNMIPAKTGDRVRTNALGSTTSYRLKMFDADYRYVAEAANNVAAIDYTITEANVAYVSVVYRGATAGQADTIMVTVNQELPSEYVAYNGEPVGYTITNYADPDNPSVVGGYYNESLTQTSKDGVNVSNLFPVATGDTVHCNGVVNGCAYMYIYDASRTLIERMDLSNTITNPQAAYAAVCYATGINNLMVMINQRVPGYYVAGTDVI